MNLAGCFLIGLSFSLSDRGSLLRLPAFRLFFVTGYLGALTTFSTYALETVNTIRQDSLLASLPNFLLNNVIGMLLVFLGMWMGRANHVMDAVLKIKYLLHLLGTRT